MYEGICWPNGLLQDCYTNFEEIYSVNENDPMIILGQAYLKYHMVTFNLEENTVTIGKSKADYLPPHIKQYITLRKIL